MRLARFVTVDGAVACGELLDSTNQRARLWDGPLWGKRPTTQEAGIDRLLAPIEPANILCIGLNYRKHAEETGAKIPEHPVVFMKNTATLQDPEAPIELPRRLASDAVDFEAELAVVIGKRCKNLRPNEALAAVLGYCCANDVSARDWQRHWGGSQWCRGKGFDTFCPLGPWLVTPEAIPDPNALTIRGRLGDETFQDAHTSDMIFDIPHLIAFLSGSTTLLPGTVILTGTPSGVGMARNPPRYLRPGDRVTIEIERIGSLSNPVIEEP